MTSAAIAGGLVALEYLVLGSLVGAARARFGVAAPAVTGHETFERYLRVQQNTLEQLAVFYPGLLLFGVYVSETGATALGAVFFVGRALFAWGYIRDPEKRAPGFLISWIANLVLLVGGLGGAIRAQI